LNRLVPIEVHYMEKNTGMFSSKTLISFRGWVNYQQKFLSKVMKTKKGRSMEIVTAVEKQFLCHEPDL